MAINTPINRDISKVKNNFLRGLSPRESIYSIAAISLGAGVILTTYKLIGINLSSIIATILVLPVGICGFYSLNDLYVSDICKSILFMPTKLVFKARVDTARKSKKRNKTKKRETKRRLKK